MSDVPAIIEAVKRIIQEDLPLCDAAQTVAFREYSVEPYLAPIFRYN